MTDHVRYGAGWGTARAMMSDSMRARVDAADHEYDRQAAHERRERAERAAHQDEMRVRASIQAALDRGELVDIREALRSGGVGRTRAELLAYVSAQQDIEDATARGRARKTIEALGEVGYSEAYTADTSAPDEVDIAEARKVREKLDARYSARARDRHIGTIARGVVRTERVQRAEQGLLRRWGYTA